MEFESWEGIYEKIRMEFGFQKENDENARDVLDNIEPEYRIEELTKFKNVKVMIAGGSKCIEQELDLVEKVDRVIAVSTAADVLLEKDIKIALH